VTQSHGNLLRGCLAVSGYLGLTPEDRILCTVPWSFDYGYGQLLTSALQGVTLILPSVNNPIDMCEAIERHRPTVLAGVPSVFTYLLRGVSPFRTTDLSSIRTVTNTGGRVPPPILEELFAMLPQAQFFLNYGLTETYRTSCLDPSLARQRPASIGKPIPGVDVAIVREDGSIAAANEVGEIVHRGDYVFLGYWNHSDATAKTLRPDPLAPAGSSARAVFTGDLGYRDEEGFLFFAGRRDHLLKSMGVRVGPGDVEDLLYRSGLVKEAAVVGRKHELLGDEVCAFVVPLDDVENAAFQLGQYARRAMSPYMVPRRFFILSELPKTANRKIDYPTLRHLAATDAAGAGSANP
jgi:acyl-coenzyme A synthetase/AMP-(fatty) acid ligase